MFHAGPKARLNGIERDSIVPAVKEEDGQFRANVASSAAILDVLPHADGVVEVEVDVSIDLELGLGDSIDKEWVELIHDGDLPILAVRHL